MNDSIKDLLKDAALPTEERAPQQFEEAQIISETKNETAKATVIKEPEPEDHGPTEEMLDSGAETVITVFDVAQINIFRFAVKKKEQKALVNRYGEKAPDKLKTLIVEQEAKENNKLHITELRTFTDEENGILSVHRAAEQVKEDLPLSESEREALKTPLKVLMKEKGGDIPPGMALLLAVVTIVGARAGETAMI